MPAFPFGDFLASLPWVALALVALLAVTFAVAVRQNRHSVPVGHRIQGANDGGLGGINIGTHRAAVVQHDRRNQPVWIWLRFDAFGLDTGPG